MRRQSSTVTTALLISAVLLAGCASSGVTGGGPPGPPGPAGSEARRGVPGFDTREYPGDAALAEWRRASPYQWVGYYLESPCRPQSSWSGRRATLAGQGWGFAVLYVGEQQWRDTTTHAVTPGQPLRCSRVNLTSERGRADADEAASRAAAEGFGRGTLIYLNVERVDSVGDGLSAYVQAWTARLLESGSYAPALYVHAQNADTLRALMAAEYRRHNLVDGPAVWVARSGSFDINAAPAESGVAYARVWQGRFDIEETWGDTRLRVDANVADRPNPSAPPQ